MPPKKILIVEDDRFFSMILKGRLEKEGFQVFQAFDGQEGLVIARQEVPDLIVLDLIMPKVSGFEFLQTIVSDPQLGAIPILVVSQLGQDSDVEKAKALGVREYYIKVQTSVEEFVERVKGFLQ